MSGGCGRLSKQNGSSGCIGESIPGGASALNPGVPITGSGGRSGDPGAGDVFVRTLTLWSGFIIGVTVVGCNGRWESCGVEKLLIGVSVFSAASLDLIMGVVVLGASGVEQGVCWPFSGSIPWLCPSGLCGVTSIILVKVAGGTGDFRRSSGLSVQGNFKIGLKACSDIYTTQLMTSGLCIYCKSSERVWLVSP